MQCNAWLQEFFAHSVKHCHGWGIAWLDEENRLLKEPVPAFESETVKALLAEELKAAHLLAHIRLASVGSLKYENSHPFVKRDRWGRVWVLEHNGPIFDGHLLDAYKAVEEGQTDSERIACCLIDRVNRLDHAPAAEERFALAEQLIADIAPQNKINLLFWDGEFLYVHTNLKGTLYQKELPEGIVVATTPLDADQWTPVPMQQLQVWRNGDYVYQGKPHAWEYFPPQEDLT